MFVLFQVMVNADVVRTNPLIIWEPDLLSIGDIVGNSAVIEDIGSRQVNIGFWV